MAEKAELATALRHALAIKRVRILLQHLTEHQLAQVLEYVKGILKDS
jgi:hypothetical protein